MKCGAGGAEVRKERHSLADQENVDSAEIELIKVRQSSKAVVGWVHTGIELSDISQQSVVNKGAAVKSYHDRFAFILENMTRSPHFVTTAQVQEHELIGRIDGFFCLLCHQGQLSLSRHDRCCVLRPKVEPRGLGGDRSADQEGPRDRFSRLSPPLKVCAAVKIHRAVSLH